MTQYKYQYLFTLGNSIVRSSETKETLLKRADNVKDRELIESFIEQEYVGNFTQLSTGEFIFQTA